MERAKKSSVTPPGQSSIGEQLIEKETPMSRD